MPRVLLVLPTATYRAADFLAAAERLGAEVVTASERPQALAAVMGDRFLEVPLERPEEAADRIVALAARRPLDAVLAVDDQGVLLASLAAQRLGLPHAAPGAVAATRDKAEMRRRLAAAGVPQPAFALAVPPAAASREERVAGLGEAVIEAARAVGFPAVVKPCCLSASRGVIRVENPEEAREAASRARAILGEVGAPAEEPLLVESYVPGEEVALEGLLTGGRLEVLALFDKPDPLEGPYFEETLYVTPSRHPASLQRAVHAAVSAAAAALGLSDGPVHAEARLPPAGAGPEAVMLELAARTIGGRCSKALTFATGASLEEVVLAHALGHRPATAVGQGAAGVMMLPIPASGRLQAVEGGEDALSVPGIIGLELTAPLGRPVRALPEGDRYLGFLFARGSSPEEVESALRAGYARLRVRVAAAGGGPAREIALAGGQR